VQKCVNLVDLEKFAYYRYQRRRYSREQAYGSWHKNIESKPNETQSEVITNTMCLDEILLYRENLEYAIMNVTEYYSMKGSMKKMAAIKARNPAS